MKKILLNLVLILGLSIIINSCGKNDKSDIEAATLIGKWSLVSYEVSNFENTGKTVDDSKGISPRPTMEFKANGTSIDNILGNTRTMGYKIEGNQLSLDQALYFSQKSFDFTVNSSTLTLNKQEVSYSTTTKANYTETTKIIFSRVK